MRLLVFHNPNAGHEEVPRETLVPELQRAGHEVLWAEKGSAQLDAGLAQPLDAVVVVGGDGSVASVGRLLAGRNIPIAILPAGTANNIASIVGATPGNLLQLLDGRRTIAFDVGVLDGIGPTRRFLEGVGFGAFAETAAILSAREDGPQTVEGRADELERDRHVLRERVLRVQPCACRLDLDGSEISGEFLMVEVTNAGVIGPNLRLSSDAVPCDGLLDVAMVDVAEREELLAFVSARNRSIEATPAFTIRQARRVTLCVPGGRSLHIDGETLEEGDPLALRIGIEPGALRLFSA